jgi:DNA sulfur modification protein DndD
MIFTKIVLENYGLFSGRNEFDLQPREKRGKIRPVVLFGGKNGAGKTTFLSAIRLLFYGRRSLGDRMSQKDYDEALVARTHRNKNTQNRGSYGKVGVEFDFVQQGEKNSFYVERSWTISSYGTVTEFFRVDKEGEPFDEISATHWEAFVGDIVPERLSQLFFFDGEKIKSIAENASSNEAISEAIQSLLGLDAVLALKSDLAVYRSKLLKSEDPEAYDRELQGVNKELSELQEKLSKNGKELKDLKDDFDPITSSITVLDSQLQQRGGSLAEKRTENQLRFEQTKELITQKEQGIREACEGAAPFVMCPGIVSLLQSQLHAESEGRSQAVRTRTVQDVRDHLLKASKGQGRQKTSIQTFIDQQLDDFFRKALGNEPVHTIHGLSERASVLMEEIVSSAGPDQASQLAQLFLELEDAHQTLKTLQRDLSHTPDQRDLADIVTALNESHQRMGNLKQKEEKLNEERRQVEVKVAQAERNKIRIEDKRATASKQRLKLAQLQKLGPALEEYRRRLAQAKIETLQSEVTQCFNKLSRKGDFVRRIEVDSSSFAVTLFDQQGRAIPKKELSSGEKQIFAIALLWGLGRTSGRPLPVVIDTPLGRLDSDHRAKLIEHYFPNASHQVILLSTDTEVDQPLFKQLSPAVSHCYHLQYDQKEGRTNATEDYFWRSKQPA